MTIQIDIKNADNRENAVVAVKLQAPSGESVNDGHSDAQLKGGESVSKYVHDGQRIVIEEVKNG